ncbi:MAG TPA: hypothetical protein VGP07_06240 [Polyangia bacterium]|jgi:H+/Cl- antiporter ClcA
MSRLPDIDWRRRLVPLALLTSLAMGCGKSSGKSGGSLDAGVASGA